MAQRTTSDLVAALLGQDYDADLAPSLSPYIAMATNLVDQAVALASARGRALGDGGEGDTAELLERNLAAHFYTRTDPVYSSRTTQGASGSFVRNPQNPEPYKANALELDPSGCLNVIMNRVRASVTWMGKPPSSQINYSDRD